MDFPGLLQGGANFAHCQLRSPMKHLRKIFPIIASFSLALMTSAARGQDQGGSAAPPVPYASVNELNNILGQLRQTSQNLQDDLSRTRIERWKTDSSTKRQTQANVESIQRNLQSALPEIVSQMNKAPEDMAASFKLYRNIDALYDVLGSVAESAGAFGSKDEFQSLSNDLSSLESIRRSLGERIQNLASSKETELARLRGAVKAMQAAPPEPPKKVVVDDTEPPKKPVRKKKPTTTTANPPAQQSAPPQ
jgi:hypothetical protein